MSLANFVQTSIATAATAGATSLVIASPIGAYALPPTTGGTLVVMDSPASPTKLEVITFTGRTGSGPTYTLTGVVRGVEGTVAQAWGVGAIVLGALTAGLLAGLLSEKAPLVSPALAGTPTAPTAPPSTNSDQVATMAAVQAVVAALVGSSPEALNTLNELAAALGNDPNFAASVNAALASKAASDHNHDAVYLKASRVTISTASPSGGADGDLWFKYAL